MPPSRPKTDAPYAPARRLREARALLERAEGATVYDLAARARTSLRTAQRYLEALKAAEEPIYDEWDGKRKIWRLMPTARRESITLSTSQMLSLFLSRRVFDFLAGTGFKEDLDELFERLELTLRIQDFVAARDLHRKIHDVNEAPHKYAGRSEHVNDILTALLKEQRLEVTHDSVSRGRKTFLLDPYTLVVYKKGLYLAGFSHAHDQVRIFALDSFRDVAWKRGDGFEYPASWDPGHEYAGSFGLVRGPTPTAVRIFFTDKVARFVERRQWHPSATVRQVKGGIELDLLVHGTQELTSWVLGFGAQAEVLAPASLRAEILAELTQAQIRYR